MEVETVGVLVAEPVDHATLGVGETMEEHEQVTVLLVADLASPISVFQLVATALTSATAAAVVSVTFSLELLQPTNWSTQSIEEEKEAQRQLEAP